MKSKKHEVVDSKARIRTIFTAVAVVIVIAIIAGIAIYRDRVAPFRTTILVVDDASIPMRYFLKRISLAGSEPMVILQTLMREQIIKQVAPKPPYNIEIEEEEIDQLLREMARGASEGITEDEYNEWYRQQLNESRLSKLEFRDLARTTLLRLRLTEYLAQKVPTIAVQVHLQMIPVQNFNVAEEAKYRLDAGEDFTTLARELSADKQLRENGGDLGWFPRSGLPSNIAQAAFDQLDIGEVSEPVYLPGGGFAIIMVSEKAAAREIDEDSLQSVRARALDEWFQEEAKHHELEFHGFNNGYDSETDTWVRWQVERMKK